jgi:CPA2 family monovalent cation:H+ antiporter-2
MHDAHAFLQNLAILLAAAACTTVLFKKLRQPVVLGYLLAGVLVGPHVPVPLVVDPAFAHTLAEVGVVLLMFSLGLEFSLRKLLKVGTTAGIIAVIQCSLMVWLGYVVGRAFGWTAMESVFTGALIAISSTTIIVKAFAEQGVKGRVTELVFGVLIVEDLIAILLLALLTAVATGSGVSAGALAGVTAKLAAFLVGMVVVGLLVVPRLVRSVLRLGSPETTLVASVGICFVMALLAQTFGYSVALGAFLGGALVAESGEARQVEHLVQPVRDMFAAIFFVAVGMLIEPALIAEHWLATLVLTLVVVAGKVLGVSLGAFLAGQGTRTSVQAGMSLAQIGEFSFIIAGVGLSLGATGRHLYPIAVAVSAATTLLTPFLIRAAGPAASWVDRTLPRRAQTFVALYGSWVEQLGQAHRRQGTPVRLRLRRLGRLLLVDAACLAAVLIGTSVSLGRLGAFVAGRTGLEAGAARLAVVAAAGALALPFLVGIARCARALGEALALEALPAGPTGRVDLAAAPRGALTATLQVAILLLVGVPLVALTQPFLPAFRGAAVLVLALAVLGFALWRSTTNLHGHVRAGAQVIADVLSRQSRAEAPGGSPVLEEVGRVLPGLGDPTAVQLGAESPAVGRTLAELNLRGLTGATVLAISRGEGEVLVPTGKEALRAGDLLALAGTRAAVDAARALLTSGEEPPGEGPRGEGAPPAPPSAVSA